jgi:hypothetical protein
MRRMQKGLAALIAGVLTAAALVGCGAQPSTHYKATVESTSRSESKVQKSTVTDDALAYLEEIALGGFEFGSGAAKVYKWTNDVRVQVSGSPTESDLAALEATIADLNNLIDSVQIKQVESGGNVTVYYGPDEEFPKRLSGYTPGNRGYFQVRFDSQGRLTRSDILISTEVGVKERAHLLREELTQSMGFFRDSYDYKDSIFFQGWTTVQQYTDLDEAIIRLLYDDGVAPGMTPGRATAALQGH